MYKQIIITKNELDYLRSKDEKLKLLIESIESIDRKYIPDPFIALVNSIVYQQLSFKAANTIWNRLEEKIKINPESVMEASFETLRECGLSKSKISYIKNIAEAVINNELDFHQFNQMSDEEIINKLIEIKGIGVWTAEMFLIFSLNRKDVVSYSDLAILKGLKWLFQMKDLPTKDQFNKIKGKFSPYNTIVSFYLWEITIRNYFRYATIDEVRIGGDIYGFNTDPK